MMHGWKFRSHLDFMQSWIGSACHRSTILIKNRRELVPSPEPLEREIDRIWNSRLRDQVVDLGNPEPKSVVKSMITSSPHLVQLRNEVFEDRKQLRKTQVGQLFIKQLKKWIEEAKDDMKSIKRRNGDTSAINKEIADLKNHLHTWENLKYPHVKSKRENEKVRRSEYRS